MSTGRHPIKSRKDVTCPLKEKYQDGSIHLTQHECMLEKYNAEKDPGKREDILCKVQRQNEVMKAAIRFLDQKWMGVKE